MSWRFWHTLLRLAWRDLRASWKRAAFTVAAIAISIASVTGLDSAATFVRSELGRDSRVWLAGDLAAETIEPVGDRQIAQLDAKRREGFEWTMITWVLTQASSDQSADRVLLSVKAIDPAVYPFYGTTLISPRGTLRDTLRVDTVVVSDQVIEKLHVKVGDRIRIGGQPFTIAGAIAAEPERTNGIFSWGPRAILSRDALSRLGATATSPTRRILVHLPKDAAAKEMQGWLQALFPEARVFDYREAAAPEVARMELSISFASVICFLVLVLGAIGIATAMRLNLEQKIAMLARMRILGARFSAMFSLFLVEAAAMLAAGMLAGIPLGWGLKRLLLSTASRSLVIPGETGWSGRAAFDGTLATAVILALVLAGPAQTLRRLRPLAVLRGERARSSFLVVVPTALAACAVAVLVAFRLIRDWRPALLVAGAMLLAALASILLAAGGLAVFRRSIAALARFPILKHAIIGLCRPGEGSLFAIACVALGVMVIAATFDTSRGVIAAVTANLPYSQANLVIADFADPYRGEVKSFLEAQPGVERVQMIRQTWLRVTRVNGVRVEDSRFLARCAPAPVADVTLADDLAARLGATLGSNLEFETRAGVAGAKVGHIYHPSHEERFWFTALADCRALPESGVFDLAAAHVRPDRVKAVRGAVNDHFPALAVITAGEIESTIRTVAADALAMVRIITWMAAAGGLFILMAVVTASRAARAQEIAVFAALGARRAVFLRIYSAEFVLLGALAGASGGILGGLMNSVILFVLFYRAEAHFSPWNIAGATLVTSLFTLIAGWLPIYGLLSRKPVAIHQLNKEG